jgi:hypothetical protein
MQLKQVKKGDPIYRPIDNRLVGYAKKDGLQVSIEPHEIATFKRCFLITDPQMLQIMLLNSKPLNCKVEISMEPVE